MVRRAAGRDEDRGPGLQGRDQPVRRRPPRMAEVEVCRSQPCRLLCGLSCLTRSPHSVPVVRRALQVCGTGAGSSNRVPRDGSFGFDQCTEDRGASVGSVVAPPAIGDGYSASWGLLEYTRSRLHLVACEDSSSADQLRSPIWFRSSSSVALSVVKCTIVPSDRMNATAVGRVWPASMPAGLVIW